MKRMLLAIAALYIHCGLCTMNPSQLYKRKTDPTTEVQLYDKKTVTQEIKIDITLSTEKCYVMRGLCFKLNHTGNFECRYFDPTNIRLQSEKAHTHLHITNVNQNDATIQYELTYTHLNGHHETIANTITIPIDAHEQILHLGLTPNNNRLNPHCLATLIISAQRRETSNSPYKDIKSTGNIYLESLIFRNPKEAITGSMIKRLTDSPSTLEKR